MMTCSAPADCAEIERRHATGRGLLVGGGASRGNLLSGEADEVILTVSRMDAEKRANPGYRAFLANGFNVTRELVLFAWEVALEYSAAIRQRRRDVVPRGERGGRYPYLRAALCVVVRDLIVLRRADRHDARTSRRLCHLLELRRGRAPLGAGARRHARGAAQARPAVRPDRARPSVRAASLQDRRPLRPRPDAGHDVQAAQRLRARRARPTVAGARQRLGDGRRRRARRTRSVRRCRRPPAARRLTSRPATSASTARSCSGRATSASST